jgi:hypothetical protein
MRMRMMRMMKCVCERYVNEKVVCVSMKRNSTVPVISSEKKTMSDVFASDLARSDLNTGRRDASTNTVVWNRVLQHSAWRAAAEHSRRSRHTHG